MQRSGRRQTWSAGGTSRTKRKRRHHHFSKSTIRRRRMQFLFLVGAFVLFWLCLIMSIVSWIGNVSVVVPANESVVLPNLRGADVVDEIAPDVMLVHSNEDDVTVGIKKSDENDPGILKEIQKEPPRHRDFRPHFQRYSEDAPSCNPITSDDIDFTLVTQLSNDRLWMMKHHCERWGSKISLAILTNRTYPQVLNELNNLGCDTAQLTLQVLSAGQYPPDEYPVNVLRNMALRKVTTTHVMYADIDFWESIDLRQLLHLPTVRQHLAENHKHAIVVPAFQLNRQCREWRECPEKNIPKMPKTQAEMLSLLKKKKGYPFDPTNRGGHGSTMYQGWITKQTEPGNLLTIPCVNSNRYEPYLAFRYCRDLPPYQEEFSGYGKNKMTMMMHMIRSGYRFDQLGGGFLVHYPHLDSISRMEWNEAPKEAQPKNIAGKWFKDKPEDVRNVDWTAYKRGRVDATFVEFRKWLAREVPDEAVIHKCSNAEDDDSRLWYDRDEQ